MLRILRVMPCVLTIALLGASASRPADWAQPLLVDGVPNLHKVTDRLYRSAQPTAAGMRRLEAMGIRTVINLRAFQADILDYLRKVDVEKIRSATARGHE